MASYTVVSAGHISAACREELIAGAFLTTREAQIGAVSDFPQQRIWMGYAMHQIDVNSRCRFHHMITTILSRASA